MSLVRVAAGPSAIRSGTPDSDQNSSDSSATEPPRSMTITKSKYWFDDGNIILQVENTQFRVHRSMLCRHSTVFRDMFDFAQPPPQVGDSDSKGTEGTDWVDGCPLVYLSDRVRDFEHLMSIFYDNIGVHDMRVPMPLDHCAAIIRLGKKYDIECLLNEGLRRFYNQFPSDVAGWDELCNRYHQPPGQAIAKYVDGDPYVDSEPFFYERAMALAYEVSLKTALPGICLSLTSLKDINEILESLERHSPNEKDRFHFTPHLLKRCLSGRDKILCQTYRELHGWSALHFVSPIPAPNCERSMVCSKNRAEAISIFEARDRFSHIEILEHPVPPLDGINGLLCKKCEVSVKNTVEKFRYDLWQDLPSIFGIGETWEDLKDF